MDITKVDCESKLTSLEKQRVKHKTWKSIIRRLLKSSSPAQELASDRRLTVEDIKQWELSLERLLSHRYGQTAFQIFLKSEYCEENIEFWLACEKFRKITSPAKLISTASRIYEEFIVSESPKEINLDYQTKDFISQNLKQPTHTCFAGAQNKIYSLMENSSYPRFIQSELFKDLCKVALKKGHI